VLASDIRALSPPVSRCSDVHGAVAAAAESFELPTRRLLVVSDLRATCVANRGGRLDDVSVLVAHLCWNARACARARGSWGAYLRGRGAHVQFVRLDRLASALGAFLRRSR
jgi:hypothetical protein